MTRRTLPPSKRTDYDLNPLDNTVYCRAPIDSIGGPKLGSGVGKEMKAVHMTSVNPTDRGPSRDNVALMFNRIAHRYDLLNHLLSANRDKRWRRKLVDLLPPGENLRVLDLATGTGDQLLSAFECGRVSEGIGLDPAEKMLEIGREKIARRGLADRLRLETGFAESLPVADKSIDAVTISFGIRNVGDVSTALSEMTRVLRPGGRALMLEFSLPSNAIIRRFYLFYFRHILPRLGGVISGDSSAYRYLNRTVETFPYGEDFLALMRSAGFRHVQKHPLTFGIATIYRGDM